MGTLKTEGGRGGRTEEGERGKEERKTQPRLNRSGDMLLDISGYSAETESRIPWVDQCVGTVSPSWGGLRSVSLCGSRSFGAGNV